MGLNVLNVSLRDTERSWFIMANFKAPVKATAKAPVKATAPVKHAPVKVAAKAPVKVAAKVAEQEEGYEIVSMGDIKLVPQSQARSMSPLNAAILELEEGQGFQVDIGEEEPTLFSRKLHALGARYGRSFRSREDVNGIRWVFRVEKLNRVRKG